MKQQVLLPFTSDNIVVTNFREISNEELTQRIINKEIYKYYFWDKKTRLSLAGVQDKLPLVVLDDNKYGIGEGKIASTHILKFEKINDII
jgi:serine/threonine-protein kinase HipA